MRKNIKFCMGQMKVNALDIVFKTLQISVTFLVLAYLIQAVFDYHKINTQITAVIQKENIYIPRDMLSNEYMMELSDEKYTKSFQRLISEILDYSDLVVVDTTKYMTIQEKSMVCISATANFFSTYSLKIADAVDLWEQGFDICHDSYELWVAKVKPAIVGFDYSRQYKLNDIIADDNGEQYQIVGFLQKDSFLSLPMQSAELTDLNRAIVTPVNVDLADNNEMMDFIFSCQFPAQSQKNLQNIEKVNREESLLEMYFQSYEEQMVQVKEDTTEKIILYSVFGLILCVFSIVSTLCMIVQIVSDYSYEYAINLLCGATIHDILQRITLQFAFMLGSGVLMTCFLCKGGEGLICVSVFAMIYMLLVVCYTRYKIDASVLVDNLRRRDER